MPLILHPDARARIEMLVESDNASEPPVKQTPPAAHSVVLEGDADKRTP